MALAKEKPLYPNPADIEDDLESWCYEQAELLRQKRFSEADLANIVEELESLGREQRPVLRAKYRLLICDLLTWQFQPDLRSTSLDAGIAGTRHEIFDREEMNLALSRNGKRMVRQVYPDAVREAASATGLARGQFPADCPYTLEQLRDPDWMPE
jgi:hypothetical protein